MTFTLPRRRKRVNRVDVTHPIEKGHLARALLQILQPKQLPQRAELKALGLVLSDAIDDGLMKPVVAGTDYYDLHELISFARNRTWKRTLKHLNTLCNQCTVTHGVKTEIFTQYIGKKNSRPAKTSRKPRRKIPEILPQMTSCVGEILVVVDEVVYPDNAPELLVHAKELNIKNQILESENVRLRTLLNKNK